MTTRRERRQFLDALPGGLLGRPLAYIQADHLRQRVLCHLMEQLAEDPHTEAGLAREVASHLAHDMRLHVIDEEEDLFPLLRRRAPDDAELATLLGRLAADHQADQRLAGEIAAGLEAWQPGRAPSGLPRALREALRLFAGNQRRHLALENARVLPLARRCLDAEDLRNLSLRMAARRGVLLRLKEHEPA